MTMTTVTAFFDKPCKKLVMLRSLSSLIWLLQSTSKIVEILSQTAQNAPPIQQLTRLELQHPIDRDPIKIHRSALDRISRARHVISPV
jgi:hypothetical protein